MAGRVTRGLHWLRVFAWGEPPANKAERRLLFKIDWFVLSFTCLVYWSNYLNRTNFSNAYVSGMKDGVGFEGNQYSVVNTVFTVGYIVGQVPNNLMLQVCPAYIWLPLMSLVWAALSMVTAAATKPGHVMAIRFFQAIAESSTFSGTHYLLGSWYKDEELGKRSGIFASSAQLGSLFSGVLQGAIFKNLQGYRGLASWQWLFLLDGFIAVPIAVYGFLCFPGTPTRGRRNGAWFLTEAERKLAVARLPPRPHTQLGWDLVRRVLGRWHWYAFSALFAISSMLESVGSNGLMQLWLAAENYPPQDRNYYPLGATAVAIVATILAANASDMTGKRWPVNLVMAGTLIFTSIVLLIWDVPYGLKFFAWTISGVGYAGQAANFAWCNTVTRNDDQERAVVIASMNLWSNVVQAWWSITFFAADLAPRFHRGWIATIVAAVVTVLVALVTRHLDYRERRQGSLAFAPESTAGPQRPEDTEEGASLEEKRPAPPSSNEA